jgi:excinuclease UvrABC nuclease subunit
VLPLDCGQEFDIAREDDFFSALPPRPTVFVIEPKQEGGQVFLSRTADLRRRLERLLRPPDPSSKRLNLRAVAARVRYRLTGSPFEQALILYDHAHALHPRRYRDFLRLRPPSLLKLNLAGEYPRCYVTRRVLAGNAFYFGPFPSRKSADAFASEFLNLFKIRRCQIKIRRDPAFPGCIYSEMKMCLAPCFAGCSKEEYDVEVVRVKEFLATCGGSLTGEFERERAAASEVLDFERAAATHKKIEKVAGVLRALPDLPRRLEDLNAVLLQLAAEENTIAIFPIRAGRIADPFFLRFAEMQSQPRSIEAILREKLLLAPGSEAITNHVLEDHLSLLARWFYGKPRLGEILFAEPVVNAAEPLEWPYRRMIRACSRLLAPPTQPMSPAPEIRK